MNTFLANVIASFLEDTKGKLIVQLNYDRLPLRAAQFTACKKLIGHTTNAPIVPETKSRKEEFHFCGYSAFENEIKDCDYLIATDVRLSDPWDEVLRSVVYLAKKCVPDFIAIDSALRYQKRDHPIISTAQKKLEDQRYIVTNLLKFGSGGLVPNRVVLFMRKQWTF